MTSAIKAFRNATHHAALAAIAQRAGDEQKAWEHRSHARFYRTAARGFLNGFGA